MNIPHLETGPLSSQATWPQGGQSTLVRDTGKRIGLIHELRKLARTKELLNHRRNRFRIDQIMRHERLDLLKRHSLLDRSLHPHQSDPVLILK